MTKVALQADGLFVTKYTEEDLEGFSPEEIKVITPHLIICVTAKICPSCGCTTTSVRQS